MDTKGGFAGLIASRKVLATSITSFVAVVIQILGFWAQMKGWSPQELDRWVFVTNVSSFAVFVAGMFVAWLWHRESFARDFGVTDITPEELAMRGKVLEELAKRLSPETMQLLALAPKAATPQVD